MTVMTVKPVNTNSDYTSKNGVEQYKLKSGGKRYRVRFRDHNGKNRSKTFSSSEDAKDFHARLRLARQKDESLAGVSSDAAMTFNQFVAEYWMPRSKAKKANATWNRDKIIYNKHIVEAKAKFPQMLLTDIRPSHIEAWIIERQNAGIGEDALKRLLVMLSTIFKYAIFHEDSTGLIRNPMDVIERPTPKKDRAVRTFPLIVSEFVCQELERNSLRITRTKGQIVNADEQALKDSVFMSLMLNLGCRPGEAMALKWSDISSRDVTIDKAVDGDGLSIPKNKRSRTAPLTVTLKEDLDRLRKIRKPGPGNSFVLTKSTGGHWLQTDKRNWVKRCFKPAVQRVIDLWPEFYEQFKHDLGDIPEELPGLEKATPYLLGRHTHSALYLQAGTPLNVLAAMQGHSVQTLSAVYTHEIDQVLRGKRVESPDQALEEARQMVNDWYES